MKLSFRWEFIRLCSFPCLFGVINACIIFDDILIATTAMLPQGDQSWALLVQGHVIICIVSTKSQNDFPRQASVGTIAS